MGLWRDKPKEERQADLNRYRSLKKAGEQAAKALRDECPHTKVINDGIIEAEKNIPWWRR